MSGLSSLSTIGTMSNYRPNETIDAAEQNSNENTIIAKVNSIISALTSGIPETGLANVYTLLQSFGVGIATDTITNYTNNADLILSMTGTGKFKYGGSDANLEVATKLYVGQTIASGVVSPIVFTGCTDLLAGASGLVPQPAAAKTRKPLRGDATFGNELPMFADIKSANFDFAEDYIYPVNLSGGAFTGTLPASPNDGARCGIKDINHAARTNNFTFGRNGKTMQGTSGLTAANIEVDINGAFVILEYRSASGGWFLL